MTTQDLKNSIIETQKSLNAHFDKGYKSGKKEISKQILEIAQHTLKGTSTPDEVLAELVREAYKEVYNI